MDIRFSEMVFKREVREVVVVVVVFADGYSFDG